MALSADTKKRLLFVAKLGISVGILAFIAYKISHRENAEQFFARITSISPAWALVALVVQLVAMACSIVRWKLLLGGQGIKAPLSHLIRTFWVGRFFSAVSPGGWTGLDAYRIFDIAKHTDKTARATATVVVDKLIGQSAMGAVVIAGSIFGARYIGTKGVLLVDGIFVCVIAAVFLLLVRPTIFRLVGDRLPQKIRGRLASMIEAVTAYRGKGGLLGKALLLSIGTHAFTNLIYVASAKALGSSLAVGDVFFVSSLQVIMTLVTPSINGVGVREATAVKLYSMVGVPESEALLIPIVGFAIDMIVSAAGGLFLLLPAKTPAIEVEDPDRESRVGGEPEIVADTELPKRIPAFFLGLGAGLLGGALLGLAEAGTVVASAAGRASFSVFAYGAGTYAVLFGGAAAFGLLFVAQTGRWMRRSAEAPNVVFGRVTAACIALPGLAIGAFRVRRDLYEEQLVWKSPKGLLILLICVASAAVAYFVISFVLRRLTSTRAFSWLVRPWGAPLVTALLVLGAIGAAKAKPPEVAAPPSGPRAAAPAQAGPMLVIVVDTLRADHLPAYGYRSGRTPNLDAFAGESIRFANAFSNASWTRPSFATILTGRYPSSHNTMGKSSSLPDAITTFPESLNAHGYRTHGIVTNYNVAPFFHFDQGFDAYEYLEPEFVLGANDTAAKLLLIQFARQRIETFNAKRGVVEPGSAYRDAETVNASVFRALDGMPAGSPWMLFVGYMDPHDPYFEHPYSNYGYSRAAHQTPDASEADELRRLYDGEITYWDEHFGRLIADLKRRGIYDQLTIVITSDHGEEFAEHGGFWHGTTLYDEQVRIPLFVKLPFGQRGGQVRQEWVQHVDVMPTLLRLAGIDAPEGVQGHDVFDASAARTEAFAEESHEGNVLTALRMRRDVAELKLITANPGNPRGLAETELYRVDQDARELVNLAEELPFEREAVRARLSSSEREASVGAVRGEDVAIGADEAARLQALGYAGASGEAPREDAGTGATPAP